jgi:hypothetical protein
MVVSPVVTLTGSLSLRLSMTQAAASGSTDSSVGVRPDGRLRPMHTLRNEDVGVLPKQACHTGHRPAVVAVGGGHRP